MNDFNKKSNKIFFVMCLDLSFWALMDMLMSAVTDAGTATLFRRYAVFFWGTFYSILLHFIIVLTKKERLLNKPWAVLILYSPAAFSIYLYFFLKPVTSVDIVRLSSGWAFLNPIGYGLLWDNFFNLYYVSYVITSILLLWIWSKNTKLKREKKQSRIIMTALIIVMIMGSITDVILPQLVITLVPPLAIIFILLPIGSIWYSIRKYKLMNLNPDNLLLDVFKIMNEGLIIVSQEGIIQEVNKGALKLLGYDKKQLKDQPVEDIFIKEFDISELNDNSTFELDLLSKNNEAIPALFSSSVLKDEFGDKYGYACIFQDLSEYKQIQNKLKEAYDELEIRVQNRTQELRNANCDLKNEITARISMEEKIRNLAFYDHLTGLPNRRLFNDRLDNNILNYAVKEKTLAIMFLDLDSFKMINDTMGHARGDELLKQVAKRLTDALRKSDTVARVGGDEFFILVDNISGEEEINKISDKILNIFKQPFQFGNDEIYITTSIGIVLYPIDGKDSETLIKNADIAMYRAKENGKNKSELCTTLIKNKVAEDMKLTNNLYRALERNELELYYQPQVNSISGEIVGFEALIRWHHPEIGLISPAEFIPIAEKTGLIVQIGEWVIRTACIQNKAWQDKGLINVPVAVNLSANQFQNSKMVEMISGILSETNLHPDNLELELTEGILMKEIGYVNETLKQLKKLGVRISIDDFGTEYASFNYLKQLPIDRIKIAMPFVQGITINHKDEAIIKAIITLAKNLNMNVIAEGVETEEQLEFLKRLRCEVIQGFYYYKPMTANQIEELCKIHYTEKSDNILSTAHKGQKTIF